MALQTLTQVVAAVQELQQCSNPVGTILPFAGVNPPSGWLLCDGQTYPRIGTYSRLFEIIGTLYGVGDNTTTFNVPDADER